LGMMSRMGEGKPLDMTDTAAILPDKTLLVLHTCMLVAVAMISFSSPYANRSHIGCDCRLRLPRGSAIGRESRAADSMVEWSDDRRNIRMPTREHESGVRRPNRAHLGVLQRRGRQTDWTPPSSCTRTAGQPTTPSR
jgi:hypothetical protein